MLVVRDGTKEGELMANRSALVTLCFVWLLSAGCKQSNDELFLDSILDVRDELSASVDIRETPISDESLLTTLNGLAGLKNLNLDRSPVTDAGLASIGTLPGLETLSLSRTQITNDGVKTIVQDYPGLTFLRLDETVISDDGIDVLPGLTKLEELSLYRVHITDRGCKSLAKLTALRRLSVDETKISDVGFKTLGDLPLLERLSIWQCPGVSDQAVERFEKNHPDVTINR
jgi:Leucine Rich repeat